MTWFTAADFGVLLPIIALVAAAFAALLADAFLPHGGGKGGLAYIALTGVIVAAFAVLGAWARPAIAVHESLAVGPFAAFFGVVVLGATALAALSSIDYARAMGFEVGEYYGLLLLAATGMLLLVAANDLVTLFIAFEIMSLSIYCLVGVGRRDARGAEGAMKYFVLGAFSSAFLLYGLALLYGATGTIYLDQMAGALGAAPANAPRGLVLAAIGLLVIGFGFKVGAVPFHAWIPDAYQGAPASVTGYMAVAVKAAAFGVFFRVLAATGVLAGAGPVPAEAPGAAAAAFGPGAGAALLWTLAAATMILGNAAALTQSNLKRLFAYSGIAHSGYVLVGLAAATRRPDAAAGALFYLAGYAATTIGAFAVVTTLRREGRDVEDVEDLGGLARERPVAALCMSIFMASLVGLPPTVGFMGKLWMFRAAVAAGMTGLVVIALLTTAISIYYYLRVIAVMYTADSAGARREPASWAGSFAFAVAALATLLVGVFPAGTLEAATSAVKAMSGR
jgi:NADH-quinone oxidoreductase subunit N